MTHDMTKRCPAPISEMTHWDTNRSAAPFATKLPVPRKSDATGGGQDNGDKAGTGTQTLVKPEPQLKEPSFYKVVLLNDDFTPMDFVVHVLQKFFSKSTDDANRIMLQIHQQGAGVAGVFSREIAETKVFIVNDYARKNQHPLKCTMEKES